MQKMMIRDKYTKLCSDLDDTRGCFESYGRQIRSAVAVTGEIAGYIEEKSDNGENRGRLFEMSQDCRIYLSRLFHLESGLGTVAGEFAAAKPSFDGKETPEDQLKPMFTRLVGLYLAWYERYNDFKIAFTSAKDKWYGFEAGMLRSV